MEPTEVEQHAEKPSASSSKEDSVLKKPGEVQKEVEELNQRVQSWVYELPKSRVENFSKPKKDLITKNP